MQSLCALFESAVAVVLAAACTIYIINPRRGRELLKGLAIGILGCYLGLAAAQRLLVELPGPVTGLVLVGLSVAAYVALRTSAVPARGEVARPAAAERTPVLPPAVGHQEEQL